MVRFTANTVVVDESNEDFLLVGFADEQNGVYRDSLHFQRSYKFDFQDVELGMASVYAERNGQGQGGYGGVARVELYPVRVRVLINGDLAKRMGTQEFDIGISLAEAEFGQLRDGLRKVFDGVGSLFEYTTETIVDTP